jgi:hypothetical protein
MGNGKDVKGMFWLFSFHTFVSKNGQ